MCNLLTLALVSFILALARTDGRLLDTHVSLWHRHVGRKGLKLAVPVQVFCGNLKCRAQGEAFHGPWMAARGPIDDWFSNKKLSRTVYPAPPGISWPDLKQISHPNINHVIQCCCTHQPFPWSFQKATKQPFQGNLRCRKAQGRVWRGLGTLSPLRWRPSHCSNT